jgi:hypothetical protein
MAYTINFSLEKPEWKTLRYDLAINSNMDRIDSGLTCWASTIQPGQVGNYQDIELTDGILWMDLNYKELTVYSDEHFETILSTLEVEELNEGGSISLADWCDRIGIDDEDDIRYTIPVSVKGVMYYIPIFPFK